MRTTHVALVALWLMPTNCAGRLVFAEDDGVAAKKAPPISFQNGRPIGECVTGDDQTTGRYFQHLRTPSGVQVKRNRAQPSASEGQGSRRCPHHASGAVAGVRRHRLRRLLAEQCPRATRSLCRGAARWRRLRFVHCPERIGGGRANHLH